MNKYFKFQIVLYKFCALLHPVRIILSLLIFIIFNLSLYIINHLTFFSIR